jgi:uncharacterized protein DUF4255
MSNALAIASVTQALALLIENNLRPEIDMAVSVETRKPPAEAPTDPTITVFLYQVAPNPSMRNNDLPSRGSNGTLLARPTAALDLNYLISAYGEETELVGQRLIGCVVRTLQEIPILPTDLIEQAAQRPYLSGSDLAESTQKVRFSPIQMDIDETSKLWGMLHQTPYSLSVTYQGSLVFIDGREQPVPAKPVQRLTASARSFGSPATPRPVTRAQDEPIADEAPDSATPQENAASLSAAKASAAKRPGSAAVNSRASGEQTPKPKRTGRKSGQAAGSSRKSSHPTGSSTTDSGSTAGARSRNTRRAPRMPDADEEG